MASPPRPVHNNIVLLEEPDLYASRGPLNDSRVLHDTTSSFQRSQHHTEQFFASSQPPPPEPSVKSARRVPSHRSAGHGSNYTLHGTPFAASSSYYKRTASSSIDTVPTHYGSLRPGGPVELFTRDHIGLLLNWTIVGFFNGAIPGLVYPLFVGYLGYNLTQQTATLALFDFGWYFKFFFGFISDCYPIRRQRRKPYIFIGWTVFFGFMAAMACMHKVAWFGTEDDVRNAEAPSQGQRYVIPILISSFAHLLANVACEGLMVQFAHREGEFERGRTQLWCVFFRFIGETSGGLFAGLGLNSTEYGGDFAHAIPLEFFFASLALLALVGIVVTYYFLQDDRVTDTRQSLGSNLRRVWRFIEQRVTLQVMVALFLISVAVNISVIEYSQIYSDWLHTSTLALSVMSILQSTGYMIAAAMVYAWFLNTNWRALVLGGFAVALVLALPLELLTVWDVVRSSTLLLGKDWLQSIFEALVWLVRLLIIVEVAEPGLESTSYGFITTVCNLARMVLTSSYNIAATTWDPASTDMAADTSAVRWHLTYEFLFKYGVRFALAFVACWILPRQKRHLKEVKIRGAPNLIVPVLLFLLVAAIFIAAVTSGLLAMFESTMCLPFAGGSGCDQKDSGST